MGAVADKLVDLAVRVEAMETWEPDTRADTMAKGNALAAIDAAFDFADYLVKVGGLRAAIGEAAATERPKTRRRPALLGGPLATVGVANAFRKELRAFGDGHAMRELAEAIAREADLGEASIERLRDTLKRMVTGEHKRCRQSLVVAARTAMRGLREQDSGQGMLLDEREVDMYRNG